MNLTRPAHIETDLATEEFVCRVCGERRAWQSRDRESMPVGEIVVRAAQFVEAHETCGRRDKLMEFLRRTQQEQSNGRALGMLTVERTP